MKEKIVIVGAGLVGTLWAALLARRGYQVEVYEKRPDMRRAGFVGGRSINLALSERGWKALRLAGLEEKIRSMALPMEGRRMHDESGKLNFHPYGLEGQAIYSVSRGGLNLELLHQADAFEQVHFHFEHKCLEVDPETGTLQFENLRTGEVLSTRADLIFGADGAFSAVRQALQKRPRFNFSQQYLEHGYKELTIPPGPNGEHLLDNIALHIWPRHSFMLIALPNLDGSFTCTLFLPFEGENAFEHLNTEEDVRTFFKRWFPDAVPLLHDLTKDFFTNPTSTLVTIRCNPWTAAERVLLIGDAAHAIVPFYGQGMNAGFEDCSLLDALIDTCNGDWPQIFRRFNADRIEDADAIADLAIRNFIEMRDRVADPRFLLRKEIERWLHNRHPHDFIPVYSMVTFSHLPYRLALEESRRQDELFERIFQIEGVEKDFKNEKVLAVFRQWLAERPESPLKEARALE